MSKAVLDEMTLYYEVHGQGYPLVMIRGLGTTAGHWYDQLPAFSSEFSVITFDNRAVGRSTGDSNGISITQMAKDVIGLLDVLNLDQAHILGLSMGGMVAQEMAIRYPQRTSKLVLACTSPGGQCGVSMSPEDKMRFQAMLSEATPKAKADAAPIMFDKATLTGRPDVMDRYGEVSQAFPVETEILKKQWEAIEMHDACDRLKRIDSPTLVITGEADRIFPNENSVYLSGEIPRSELAIIPGGGHQVLIEQKTACNREILEFLAGRPNIPVRMI